MTRDQVSEHRVAEFWEATTREQVITALLQGFTVVRECSQCHGTYYVASVHDVDWCQRCQEAMKRG
jgi:hypothetical protein